LKYQRLDLNTAITTRTATMETQANPHKTVIQVTLTTILNSCNTSTHSNISNSNKCTSNSTTIRKTPSLKVSMEAELLIQSKEIYLPTMIIA